MFFFIFIKKDINMLLNENDIKSLIENIILEFDLPISDDNGKCFNSNEIYQMIGDVGSIYQFLTENEELFKNNENMKTLYPNYIDKIRRIKRLYKLLKK